MHETPDFSPQCQTHGHAFMSPCRHHKISHSVSEPKEAVDAALQAALFASIAEAQAKTPAGICHGTQLPQAQHTSFARTHLAAKTLQTLALDPPGVCVDRGAIFAGSFANCNGCGFMCGCCTLLTCPGIGMPISHILNGWASKDEIQLSCVQAFLVILNAKGQICPSVHDAVTLFNVSLHTESLTSNPTSTRCGEN